MMILADVGAVGHAMVEGARNVLVVQIALKAMIRNFFLFFATDFIIYWLTGYCPDNTPEMIIELTGNDTGSLTEGWEIITHIINI